MSKRKKDLKFYADEDRDPTDDSGMYEAPKGKKPRSRDRKKGAKKGYYDD